MKILSNSYVNYLISYVARNTYMNVKRDVYKDKYIYDEQGCIR